MDDLAAKGFMIINCKLEDRSLDTTLDRIQFCINMTQKAVILLDELYSLSIQNKCSETNQLINFFAKVRESKFPTIIMSTINDPLKVHESIMERSGRIDETIEVGFPDEELMEHLVRSYCSREGYNIPDEVYKATVAKLVKANISAADVENFSRQIYVKNGKKDTYTQADLDVVIDSFTGSRTASRKTYYQRDAAIQAKKASSGDLR
jgi:SpoVK/Ycf46/Vps4 family AAA+-type ATPase